MQNQNLILYDSGCYGTFIEWFFNWITDPTIDIPFLPDGSSHKFKGNFLEPRERVFQHVESGHRYQFCRAHLGLFEKVNEHEASYGRPYEKVLQQDIDFLKSHFDKILVMIHDEKSVLWYENNNLDKTFISEQNYADIYARFGYSKDYLSSGMTRDPVQKIKNHIKIELASKLGSFKLENLQGWHKNNIEDFELWQLRELLSYYWFEKHRYQHQAWKIVKENNSEIMILGISHLRDNFFTTMDQLAHYFEIGNQDLETTELEKIESAWKALQKNMFKDRLCDNIVNALVGQESLDWTNEPLSIVDEAWIQKTLRERDVEILCDGLDVWPTNTKCFQSYLEYK